MEETLKGSIAVQDTSDKFQLIRYFFDTVTDDTLNFQSQITDNWVENNTAIHDHIAISPITVTLRGLCGDLVYTSEQAQEDYIKELERLKTLNPQSLTLFNFGNFYKLEDTDGKLRVITSYLPEISNVTQLAQNVWDLAESAYKKAKQVANILTNKNSRALSSQMTMYSGLSTNARYSRLKEACDDLKSCWLSRKSFIVNTPFGDFENMYITSINLHQGNENFIGEIDITLKQLRFVGTITTEADKEVLSKYNAFARAKEEDYGKAQGKNSELYDKWTPNSPYVNRNK